MRSLSENDLVCQLRAELNRRFDDEEFLPEELSGVVHALIGSVRRAALLTARGSDWEPVVTLHTDNHFSCEFVDEKQIVVRIENTSGLDSEMSRCALKFIEQRVDDEIHDVSAVEVEHIGVIESPEPPHYIIHLADELKVVPPHTTDDTSEVPAIAST